MSVQIARMKCGCCYAAIDSSGAGLLIPCVSSEKVLRWFIADGSDIPRENVESYLDDKEVVDLFESAFEAGRRAKGLDVMRRLAESIDADYSILE